MKTYGGFSLSALDQPEVLSRIFHPRPEFSGFSPSPSARDLLIPVEPGVRVGARFHGADQGAPTILFFHGNGEIVADYDELAPFYERLGVNFLPVDYRGYGRSGGSPTVMALLQDSHVILKFVRDWLAEQGFSGPLTVMGRSLGSAPALELAAHHPEQVDGLIIESGFAYAGPLLRVLGVDLESIGFEEEEGFRNLDKIREFLRPVLIIHAEYDHLIPFTDGQALYEACPASDKRLVKIAGANHNDLLYVGFSEYMGAVGALADKLRGRP